METSRRLLLMPGLKGLYKSRQPLTWSVGCWVTLESCSEDLVPQANYRM